MHNLATFIADRARSHPQATAVVFVHEDGTHEHISAEEFHRQSTRFAGGLQAAGIQPGDLVMLVMDHSPDLLYAFWGAIYLGAVPSIFPTKTGKLDADYYTRQIETLVKQEGIQAIIANRQLEMVLPCPLLDVTEIAGSEPISPRAHDGLAFLQHSSGTTGLQKGVALSHGAVLHQINAYRKAIALRDDDVVVSWLPLYHDMGLIAGFVLPLVCGVPLVLMSPFHWVRDPKLLLWAIHDYNGTLCWLPNFAFNHMVRSIRARDLEGLDLSTWRAAVNCSEPVRDDSHRLFLERFRSYGFRESALSVCYAMAENTFAVTQTPTGHVPVVDRVDRDVLQTRGVARPADGGIPIVSCGPPIPGCTVRVVDADGVPLPDRHIGEIILQSDSMLDGYYRRPDLTAAAIRDGWFWTGDLGYLHDGALYVTGRCKDLLIVAGKNVYPQDVEAIANDVPGVHSGRAVAFGLPDERTGTEAIVLVAELHPGAEDDPAEIERELRRRVVARLDVTLRAVKLVRERWLLKTSSGKIARAENRAKYLREQG